MKESDPTVYNGEGDTMNVDNPYNLNLESTEAQAVSENRADESVLKETFKEFFGGLNYFFAAEQADFSLEDVIAHIGVDPSEYRTMLSGRRRFIHGMQRKAKQECCMSGLRMASSTLAAHTISVFRKCHSLCGRGLLQASFRKAPNGIRYLSERNDK